jgi:2,4-dienoyl-CoA reductase-like NADH-dependent reductase (Old Yellow Enzyme family)
MLLGSFLSPLRNARTDEYGGKRLEGRARLLLETLRAIKQEAGEDFPVTVSLSGYERFPGGREINETQRLAQMLVEAGADAFRISGGTTDRLVSQMVMGSDYPDGINATASEAIKRVVDVPVIVVGRIHTPELAESILEDGRADLIAMARPFLQQGAQRRPGRHALLHLL